MAIENILWTFGIFCGNLVHFSPFWYIVARKIWFVEKLAKNVAQPIS
jgi:hypothetical protein